MSRGALTGLVVLLALVSAGGCLGYNQGDPELRAYWADAWHTGYKSPGDCDNLIAIAQATHCNALLVQMRRRGDTYWPSAIEPFADDANPSFDSLRYLLDHCHAANPPIQVHAWLVLLPIWSSGTPSNPNHPYWRYPQYLTMTDTGGTVKTFDPGHPDCEQYLNDVVMEYVNTYPDLDGISYDYSRFGGNTEGYNAVSLSRYHARYGGSGNPGTTDATWCQWRRDQITSLIRKTYANAIAVHPDIVMSSATVTWGNGPTTENGWYSTSAYSSVMQDWRAWMEEGIMDVNFPMCYDREYRSAEKTYYDNWIAYAKNHHYNRACVIGPAIYLNSIADSFKQMREVRTATTGGNQAIGICMYSYAVTNDQYMDDPTSGTDPTPDPDVPNADFYNAVANPSSYDANPPFPSAVSLPVLTWKSSPTKGHIKGTIYNAAGAWADGLTVSLTGTATRTMVADGTGFYAFIDLSPGSYTVSVTLNSVTKQFPVTVVAGQVATVDFDFCPPSQPTNLQAAATSTTQISLNWTASTDNIAVTGYKVFRGGGQVGTSPTSAYPDGGLAANTSYTYAVSAYDAGANDSTQSSSVARYTLSVPPTDAGITCPRSGGTWCNTPGFTFNCPGFGAGKVSYYRYAWDNSPTHAWTGTESQWTNGSLALNAVSGSQGWYLHVRGYNGDNIANGSLDKGPYYYDGDPPTVSNLTVPKYVAIRGSTYDDTSANWWGADSPSGIAEYKYAIGTSPGATNVLGWTSAGLNTSAGYHLPAAPSPGGSYYWSVKARDAAQNWCSPINSSASFYANAYTTLAEAMNNPDATPVIVDANKTLTGAFADCFYVQEANRTRGLKIDGSSSWQPGDQIRVAGRLAGGADERRLTDIEASKSGGGSGPAPLAVRISAIGGMAPDAYTPTIPGATGCYTIGLLVRTAGRVGAKGAGWFVISDGSGETAKVYSTVIPPDSAFVGVTGVASIEVGRAILTRGPDDVTTYWP